MGPNLTLIINSPLEQFEVNSLISVVAPIFGYINITLSNLGLYSILILIIILSLHIISNNENKILPSK
jgi:F-type H+-transporting ATPase subunit a